MHKRLLIFACFILSLGISFAQSEKRLALIIGNSQYSSGELKNAVNDANKVSAKLKTLGFDVILKTNATNQIMGEAINDFTNKASSYDVALFYYAGHGIQSEGSNYLIPVNDNMIEKESDIEYNSQNVNRILRRLEDSGCKLKILILDACRNNPFERSWHRSVASKGLAFLTAPDGTLIAYATSPGSVADDGGNAQNSPYTTAFLQTLDNANLSILEFFNEVGGLVRRNTNNKQTPWVSTSPIEGNFKFNQAKAVETKKDITFNLFPSYATIKFGNTTYENGKTLIFNIGATYSYTVEAEGYQSQSGKFTVGQSTASSMSITLHKNTSAATSTTRMAQLQNNSTVTTKSDISTLLAMGDQYYNEKDYPQAIIFYIKTANQGNAHAQTRLGNCYNDGLGVKVDYAQAAYWYQKAANQEYALAQLYLGVLYHAGAGVKQDYNKAIDLYTKAANQGNAQAQYNLGYCYDNGEGVMQNSDTAKDWYKKAASQGHEEAKKALGKIIAIEAAYQEYLKQVREKTPRIVQSTNKDSPLKLIENDLTAKIENVCDLNGMPTALIKVITTARGLYFHVEGKGFPDVVKVEQKTGEVWVYVPQGITEFFVHNRHGTVSGVSSDNPIVEAGKTYKMTLEWDTEKIPQTSTVTGHIVDAKTGEPLIAASVQVVGTQLGAIADINGKFVIKNVPDSASTLRISYIGYETEEETIYPSEMKIFMKLESSSSSRKSKKR